MRRDLATVIEVTGKILPKVVVITNGISITTEVVASTLAMKSEFKFSIHRPDASNDDVFRVSSFENVLESMRVCRTHDIPFSIHTVVTAETIEMMDDMVEFARSRGARKISFIPVVPRGRAARGGRNSIAGAELQTVHSKVASLSAGHEGMIDVRCLDFWNRDYWVIENDGVLWIERSKEGLDERVCELDDLLTA